MATYLGFDVGTQSVKALLLDDQRGVLGTATHPLATIAGLPPGHSEQHPGDWLDAIAHTARQLAAAHGAEYRAVAAIGVSGQQHGFVPLDEDFAVLRPAKLWNDTSSAAQCAAIIAEVGGAQRLFDLTGNALPPGFTAGKIRWLRDCEPERFARLRHVLLPHDYVNWWLTGEATCEAGDASGTGMLDVRGRRFAQPVLDAVAPGLEAMLPRMVAPGAPAGTLCRRAADALGLPEGILVGHGGGDNMMAAVGAGAVVPGVAVLSLGTSGTVFACAEQPICDPRGEIAAFCDSTGRWLPLGCTMNATVATELTRNLFAQSIAGFEHEAASAPPGCDGVLCLPFFTGERSPDLPDGTGAFLGLTPANARPSHLTRAAMEGATFALVRLLDRLGELGVPLRELRITGGGSRSALWCRIVAAAAGRAVHTGVHPDAAALGAAVHACWTQQRTRRADVTIETVVEELGVAHPGAAVMPDPRWQAVYAPLRATFDRAVAALTPCMPALRRGGRER